MRLASFRSARPSACRARWRCWHSSDAGTGSGKTIAFYLPHCCRSEKRLGPTAG